MATCTLCENDGGALLWRGRDFRVVRVDDPHYPGFCRLIWQTHVREMTDLPGGAQLACLRAVLAVETVLRTLYSPHKINLASFGNVTPHLHWHIIPRWTEDRHFPEPVWGTPQREANLNVPAVTDADLTAALAIALTGFNE